MSCPCRDHDDHEDDNNDDRDRDEDEDDDDEVGDAIYCDSYEDLFGGFLVGYRYLCCYC